MDPTTAALARVRRFAHPMAADIPPVDLALPAVRQLLKATGVSFRIVGGVAVTHHGYVRTTEDIDVLIEEKAQERIDQELASYGFERETPNRLRHRETGVGVHLLVAGEEMPRPGAPAYPSPRVLEASPEDPAIVGLPGLVGLKLWADRHQDRADLVALLKRLDERQYLDVEASVEPELRTRLSELRRDALEEASWEIDEA